MKNFLCLLSFFISVNLFAQEIHDGLSFSVTEFNFPKTENWVSHVDTIEATNTTNQKIFLLKQKYSREFEVRFPASAIEPSKTGIIEVVYNPSQKGKFNASIPIYHSASQTPVNIIYKGEVLSFDEFADVACPSFSKPNLKPVEFDLEISVIDSATEKPVANSFLEITKGEFFTQHQTDENGNFKKKSDIGFYIVLAEHPGYKSKTAEKHFNPKNHKLTIALSPVEKKIIIPKKDSIVISKKDLAPLPTISKTDFSLADYKKNNIVFLIDKSSSMNKSDCMPLLQSAMIHLAKMTRAEDRITIITYANEAKIVLPGTSGNEHEKIINVIQQLKCGGKTEGGKAIQTAYKNAEENFIKGGMNQIIIATDGGFNGLSENEEELMKLVSEKSKQEIKLSVLAFGQNRYGKAMILRLAKQGEGFYEFIADENDAHEKLTDTVKFQSKIK
ncbi:MAG: VWA domain-containing protein [Bacteroidetes bacterium]|nr:VWA domain-containing protein [Bacteroidota bacterium]